MARKYEVTFQGSRGQVAKIVSMTANVTAVKFNKRRSAKRMDGHFSGVRVKPAAN